LNKMMNMKLSGGNPPAIYLKKTNSVIISALF
jgi:hypothetical protein